MRDLKWQIFIYEVRRSRFALFLSRTKIPVKMKTLDQQHAPESLNA